MHAYSSFLWYRVKLISALFWMLSSCNPNSPAATAQLPVESAAAATAAEPSVLATIKHYAHLFTQPTPPPLDSLLRYQNLTVQPDLFPGRYRLRLRTHTILVIADSLEQEVQIEPAERTRLSDSLALGRRSPVLLAPRRTNPVLKVSLPELTAVFGPWHDDVYLLLKEPPEPEMHSTYLRYVNPTTRRSCRLRVQLQKSPAEAVNAVHAVSVARDTTPAP